MLKIKKEYIMILSVALIAASTALFFWKHQHPVSIAFMLATTVVAGYGIFKKAIGGLRYFIIGIELLVAIAAVGAIIIAEYWEAAMVTFLFSIGEWLEEKTVEKTRSSIRSLINMAPAEATIKKDGIEITVKAQDVQKGDIVIVKHGQKIPVDGRVLEGVAHVNQATITGESVPVEKTVGDSVFSGTVAESGYLIIEAERVGEDTAFAKIVSMVEEAQDKKARTQKFLERFAKWYTPSIIVGAVVVYLVTWDVKLALTLLTVSCPGALVISAPVAVVAGIGNGAKHGVLIKGGEILERLAKTRVVAFDKTGTLTEGRPQVCQVAAYGMSEEELLKIAAVGEAYSEHPLGRAIIAEAQKRLKDTIPSPTSANIITGQGLVFEYQGKQYLIGNKKLFESQSANNLTDEQSEHILDQESMGRTAIIVGTKEQICGIISISDIIRKNAKSTIADLKSLGIKRAVMLTGDNERAAKAVADELGLDGYYASLLPQDKVGVLEQLGQKYGTVAMVGDGVNDAPALASADLGVAMGGASSDVAMETADAVLMSADISKLRHALGLSRATVNNIRQNLAFGLAVVFLLIAGVLVEAVSMSLGMFLHIGSEILVVLNAMRLLGYRRNKKKKKDYDAVRA